MSLAFLFAFAGLVTILLLGAAGTSGVFESPFATAQVTTCPPGPTYSDGFGGFVCVPGGDAAFAQSVVSFTPGAYTIDNQSCVANNQTATTTGPVGPPDSGSGATNLDVSLGAGGVLVLQFGTPLTGNGTAAADVFVWETGPVAEGYQVDVAEFSSGPWTTVGASDMSTQGSQGFDIDDNGFTATSRLYFVRITDTQGILGGCAGTTTNRSGSDIDTVAVLSNIVPSITLDKTASPSTGLVLDQVVTYSFEVTNSGTDTLNNISIDDQLENLGPITCPATTLAPSGTTKCTATYTVTQEDIDAGSLANTATASGDPASGGDAVTDGGETTITMLQEPALSIVKTADPAAAVVADDVITYTFTVENTGNVTLTNVVVSDTLPNLSAITPASIPSLAPGDDPVAFTATYTVTQADVDTGLITNDASVTGVPPAGCQCSFDPPHDSVEVPPAQTPGLSIDKEADTAGPVVDGDLITYTFTVQNTGTVTLTGVTLSDDLAGLAWITGPELGTLVPGQTVIGEATYRVTPGDLVSGVANAATVTGNPPEGCDCPFTPPGDETFVPGTGPGLSLVKEADTAGTVNEGDVITYTFTVTNVGGVSLSEVTLSDPLEGLTWIDGPELGDLAPGASATGTASYTVTIDDVKAGGVTNAASVTGNPPEDCDCPFTPPTDETFVPGGEVPPPGALDLEKTAFPPAMVRPGDLITYTFTVTNVGSTTVTNVTVSDELAGLGPIEGPQDTTLGPGETATFTARYPVTDLDATASEVLNQASVTGIGEDGEPVGDVDAVRVSACDPNAAIEVPVPGPGTPEAGEQAEQASEIDAAASCTSEGEVIPQPTNPPVNPDPTNPPANNGGNSGGGASGGPVTQLPSTGQAGQEGSVNGTLVMLLALLLLGAGICFALIDRLGRARRPRD